MTINEITLAFETEAGMLHLLEAHLELFNLIEKFALEFRLGKINNPEATDVAMKELNGAYMTLNIIVGIAEEQKKTREDILFNQLYQSNQTLGLKAIVSNLEKQASEKVSTYRRIHNIFRAYRDSCDKAISVCQSSLKGVIREGTFHHD